MFVQFDDLQLNTYLSPVSEDTPFAEDGVLYRSAYHHYIKTIISEEEYRKLSRYPNIYTLYGTPGQYTVDRAKKNDAMIDAYMAKFRHISPAKLEEFKSKQSYYIYRQHSNPRFPRQEWSPSLLNEVLKEVYVRIAKPTTPMKQISSSIFPIEPVQVQVQVQVQEERQVQEQEQELVQEEKQVQAQAQELVQEQVQVQAQVLELAQEECNIKLDDVFPLVQEPEQELEQVQELVDPIKVSVSEESSEINVPMYLLKKYNVSWSGEEGTWSKLQQLKADKVIAY